MSTSRSTLVLWRFMPSGVVPCYVASCEVRAMGHSPVTAQSIVLLQDRERHQFHTDVSIVNQYTYETMWECIHDIVKVVCVCRHPQVFLVCSSQIMSAVLSLISYDTILIQYDTIFDCWCDHQSITWCLSGDVGWLFWKFASLSARTCFWLCFAC